MLLTRYLFWYIINVVFPNDIFMLYIYAWISFIDVVLDGYRIYFPLLNSNFSLHLAGLRRIGIASLLVIVSLSFHSVLRLVELLISSNIANLATAMGFEPIWMNEWSKIPHLVWITYSSKQLCLFCCSLVMSIHFNLCV